MVGGAEVGPVKYTRASPIAENGSEPATRIPSNLANDATGIRTPPNAIPSVKRASTMIVLNTRLDTTFAAKQEKGGIGLARLTSTHPTPRWEASPAAVPNSDAAITPNVP